MTKRIPLAVALAAFVAACSDPAGPATRTLVATPSLDIITPAKTATPPVAFGSVELCKTSNVAGSFGFNTSTAAASGTRLDEGTPDVTITVGAGGGTVCKIVYSGSTLSNAGGADAVTIVETANAATLTNIDIIQYLHPDPNYGLPLSAPRLDDSENEGTRTAVAKINSDMSRRVTFTNFTAPPPPPPACDFITFGRLVWEEGSQKVVISGNAGGFNADGSIKGEFHIEVNGVDHHVADVSTYGPIAAPALASVTYTNSRRVTGTDKHGHAVELRLWDGGEPGKGTDRFWFNVNGTIVGNATTGNLIDQGNMQYHANCRGPDQN
jgi:hypothetical protein